MYYDTSFLINDKHICDDLPMILWNIKGNALNIKPMSRFHQNEGWVTSNFKSLMKDDTHILIFMLKNLSLEDFSTYTNRKNVFSPLKSFLDTWPHIFISSMRDPLNLLQEKHCNIMEIKVNKTLNNFSIQLIALTLTEYCIVVAHLDEITRFEVQDIEELFLLSSENLFFNIIGFFTGKNSSWSQDIQVDSNMKTRKLLQAVNDNDIDINYRNCILFYATNISIIAKGLFNGTIWLESVSKIDSICAEEKNSTLVMVYDVAVGQIQNVIIRFSFKNTRDLFWNAHASVSITNDKNTHNFNFTLSNAIVKAPIGRSFHCDGLFFRLIKPKYKVKLFFYNLYVQPFKIKDNKFSPSFNCTKNLTVMTVEIFEVIIISLLCVTILAWGISQLLNIQTMERFDDPRNKAISTVITNPS